MNPPIRIDHDDDQIAVINKVNKALQLESLRFEDVSEDGQDFCLFALQPLLDTPPKGPRSAPDFAGFIRQLREEIRWSHEIHPGTAGQGQAASDRDALARLAAQVEIVAKSQGFL